DAGLVSGDWEWLHRHIRAREADVPAIGFARDRDGLGRALNWAGPAQRDAPDFGEHQEAIVEPGAAAEFLVREGVVAVAPLKTRIPWRRPLAETTEERRKGFVLPSQNVLQDMAVEGRILRHLGSDIL